MNYKLFYWAVTAIIVENSHVDFCSCNTRIYTLYFIAVDTKRYSDDIV